MRIWLFALALGCAAPTKPVAEATTPTNQQDNERWTTSPVGAPVLADAVLDSTADGRALYKVRRPFDEVYQDYWRYITNHGFELAGGYQVRGESSAILDVTDPAGGRFTISLAKETTNTTQVELIRN